MARKCLRCGAEMLEGLEMKEPLYGNMLRVTRPGTTGVLPKNWFGEAMAAVCPKCGYLETYLSRMDKIQRYGEQA